MAYFQSMHGCRSSNIAFFPLFFNGARIFKPMNFSSFLINIFHSFSILIANNYILVSIPINICVLHRNRSIFNRKSSSSPGGILVQTYFTLGIKSITDQISLLIKDFKRLNPIAIREMVLDNLFFKIRLQK